MNESNVPALTRGLDLIELIARSGSIGFSQMEKESGLNTSSLNRLLKGLTESGFITKNAEGKYELGLKIFTIAYGNSIWQPLLQHITEILHEISGQYQVTALFYIFLPTGSSILDKVVYPDNVAMRGIGDVKKDYLVRPWGFLYLAQMQDKEREDFILKIRTENREETDEKELSKEQLDRFIQQAQEQGYGDDEALINENIRRLAVPVYDKSGYIIGALAVGSFPNLLDAPKIVQIIKSLKQKADRLSCLIQGKE